MPQGPLDTGADLGVVVRVGKHPLRGALEDRQLPDVLGNGRSDLESGGAGAKHHDVLSREVDRVVPAGGVEGIAGEALRTGKVGNEWLVELAHRADHRSGPQHLVAAVGITNGDRPIARVVVPRRRDDLSVEPDMFGDTVAVHYVDEVVLQLGLAREELRPVVGRLEAVAVEVVPDIDPGAGIAVLPPGSANSGVLLDHRVGNPGLLESDRSQQPGLPGADHDHRKIRASPGGGPEFGLARIAAVETHLLQHHRHVLVTDVAGDQPGHHLLEAGSIDRRRFGTAAIAIVTDDVEGEGTRRGLVVLGHVTLHLVEE